MNFTNSHNLVKFIRRIDRNNLKAEKKRSLVCRYGIKNDISKKEIVKQVESINFQKRHKNSPLIDFLPSDLIDIVNFYVYQMTVGEVKPYARQLVQICEQQWFFSYDEPEVERTLDFLSGLTYLLNDHKMNIHELNPHWDMGIEFKVKIPTGHIFLCQLLWEPRPRKKQGRIVIEDQCIVFPIRGARDRLILSR